MLITDLSLSEHFEIHDIAEVMRAMPQRIVPTLEPTNSQDTGSAANEEHRLELTPRDTQAIVEALLNPPPPNERLQETVSRYRQVMGV